MTCNYDQLLSRATPTSLAGKILQFPLMRMFVVVLFLLPVSALHMLFELAILPASDSTWITIWQQVDAALGLVLFLIAYRLYTHFIEKRQAQEISVGGSLREFTTGLSVGTALLLTVVGLLAVLGYYRVESFGSGPGILLGSILPVGIAAFIEELWFRAIFFKLTEELLGSWIAIAIQAIYFGVAHLGNPGATIWTSLAGIFSAGLLLGAAYLYTRRVWLALGIHMGWNYFQSAVFGLPNSGKPVDGWIKPVVEGPEWLTGGSFGVEISYVTIALCFAVGLLILRMAIKRNQIVPPCWLRR